ncbi:hypothetical protein [Oceanobacillus manasiensis]|uniref:hypothetical protein n=1 Tax=Oceanobacillus manasiensis TaxID=586413 RepID=UPI0005A8FFCA|nr:hypothetical protein [Oceanobacillus manasiensis]
MSITSGTTRMVYEDARWFFLNVLILSVTLPLTILWIVLGLTFDMSEAIGSIAGPAYFFIPSFAIFGYKTLLPIGVGMGSTRLQILKSFYGVGILSVAVVVFILNVLQFTLVTLSDWRLNFKGVLHPGEIFYVDYHFLSYLWLDMMTALFLFGMAFLLYSLFYRLGLVRLAIWMMAIVIPFMFLYYGGVLDPLIKSLTSFEWSGNVVAIILGAFGAAGLAITYPIMRNAPLKPRSAKS